MRSEVRSPAVGRVLEIRVSVGSSVRSGEEILFVESMKMEIPVTAPCDGTLRELRVAVGAQVQADEVVALLD